MITIPAVPFPCPFCKALNEEDCPVLIAGQDSSVQPEPAVIECGDCHCRYQGFVAPLEISTRRIEPTAPQRAGRLVRNFTAEKPQQEKEK